tara:strand:- start:322 stop:642 length:321 start_codon:yes stop_codon:yes gene_type:complete
MSCAKERIVCEIPEKAKADLKIALHRDNLTQAMFFSAVVEAYNSRDQNFMTWFETARAELSRNKSRQRVLKREEAAANENMKKFGFNQNEIESIFDIIAEERGDKM